jgi:hypothetical protein
MYPNMTRTLKCALLVLVLTTGARAADAVAPSEAQWMWAGERGPAGSTAFFRKSIVIPGEPISGRFVAVAEFNELQVFVNGRLAAEVEPYQPLQSWDVTHLLRPGKNTLAVQARAVEGPAAVALHLELQSAAGQATTWVSDSSWRSATQPDANWLNVDWQPPPAWKPATTYGPLDDVYRDHRQAAGVQIRESDDYTQWKQALGTERSTDPASFLIPPGFEIQLLRSAQPEEGSWVSLEFDPQGRLIVAREQQGLLRMTLPVNNGDSIQVEVVEDTLLECRGLLYAHGALYVNANNSKTLVRLRDTNGDDRFDERKELFVTTGGVGHGRNDLAL